MNDEWLEIKIFEHNVGYVVMHEDIHQFGKILMVFD